MISNDQIARINELYRKQKAEGLTEQEKTEQAHLRRLYIDAVKNNLRGQLGNIEIIDKPDDGHQHHHGCSCGCDGNHKH